MSKSNVEQSSTRIDNIKIEGNTISSANADGHIVLSPNGSGKVKIGEQEISASGISTYSVLIGDGTNTTYTVTHNLNTSNDTYVVVRDTATNYYVYPDIVYVNSNSLNVIFVSAPTSNQYRVSVIGT